jgi:hypothetical protein
MTETNQDLQKRLNDVQATIKYLQAEKDRNNKEKEIIRTELEKLGIKDILELETVIKQKEQELETYNMKFNEALKKLEDKTKELEAQIRTV